MVGLSIVLETTNTPSEGLISPKVVNKSAVIASTVSESASLRRGSYGFLEHCFLCKRKLQLENDIYMYKGDRAFCSVECRSKQMIMDEEESLRRENCSSMAKSDSSSSSSSSSGGFPRHRRDPRNRAGGFVY